MKLEGLKELFKDMKLNNVDRTQFQYKHNGVIFDVIFFIDSFPYQLLFGAVGHKCSFFVDVMPGFEISPIIKPKSAYSDLCKALGLTYDPANPFSTAKFFAGFSQHIPDRISKKKTSVIPVRYEAVAIDDGDKVYFRYWKNNSEKNGNVTGDNLEKTRNAFGPEIANLCQRKNISSCWSVVQKRGK